MIYNNKSRLYKWKKTFKWTLKALEQCEFVKINGDQIDVGDMKKRNLNLIDFIKELSDIVFHKNTDDKNKFKGHSISVLEKVLKKASQVTCMIALM